MNEAETKLNEKMARVERLEKKLSDSIITIEKTDIRLATIEKNLQDLESDIVKIKGLQPAVDKNIEASQKQIQDLFINFTNLGVLVESMKKAIDHSLHFEQSIKSINESLTDHIDRICRMDAQMKKFPLEELVNGQFVAVHQVLGRDQKHIDDIVAKQEAQQKSLEQAFSSQRSCYSARDEAKTGLAALESSLKTLIHNFNAAKVDFQSKLDKLAVEVSAKVDTQIKEKLPSLDMKKISEMTKELIKTDIAFITVDSQNASLKYNNLDRQVNLLEKKIESIFLMLKKIELEKSAKE